MRRRSCCDRGCMNRGILEGVGTPDSLEIVDDVGMVLVVGVNEFHC